MNMSLLIMMGVALLLLAQSLKTHAVYRWTCLGCAVLLAIQPVIAFLKWLGGLVGV